MALAADQGSRDDATGTPGGRTSEISRQSARRLAAYPLAQACQRLRLGAEPFSSSLPLGQPALAYVLAGAFARALEESVALDGPVPQFGAIMALRNFPSLGASAREAARWLDHLRWLRAEPRLEDLGGQAMIASRLRNFSADRLALTLGVLARLGPFSGGGLPAGDLGVGLLEALGLDDLRRLAQLVEDEMTKPGRGEPPQGRVMALVHEVQGEGRWRAPGLGGTGGFGQVPPFGQASPFAGPVFAVAQSASQFHPAGANGGGLSEHAREALDVLERRAPAALRQPAVEAALARAREAIVAFAAEDAAPEAGDGRSGQGRGGRRAKGPAALVTLERLVQAAPLSRTSAVRTDRRPLEAAQVVALVWHSIETFPADVPSSLADVRWVDIDPATLGGLRAMWLRGLVDSLAALQIGRDEAPYVAIERLLSELPPFLRSDREVDLDAFFPVVDVELLLAEARADHTVAFPPPPDGLGPQEAHLLATWRRETWMGTCEARLDRVWSAPDDPRRLALLAQCAAEAPLTEPFFDHPTASE